MQKKQEKMLVELIKRLRDKGFRVTAARKHILALLIEEGCALTAQAIYEKLQQKKVKVDLSTIYREMQFLVEQKIASDVCLKDNVQRYELLEGNHHHHCICVCCNTIESIEMDNELQFLDTMLAKKKKFKALEHALEFYGLCKPCTTETPEQRELHKVK